MENKMSKIKDPLKTGVTKDNYRNFKYYADKPLSEHTNGELQARKYYNKGIYGGRKTQFSRFSKKLEDYAIMMEEQERLKSNINPHKKDHKGENP
jgi:hypothetical protein